MSIERIERLEERLAWLERHVVEQDKTMLELSDGHARLRRELEALRARLEGGPDLPPAGEERPPHY